MSTSSSNTSALTAEMTFPSDHPEIPLVVVKGSGVDITLSPDDFSGKLGSDLAAFISYVDRDAHEIPTKMTILFSHEEDGEVYIKYLSYLDMRYGFVFCKKGDQEDDVLRKATEGLLKAILAR